MRRLPLFLLFWSTLSWGAKPLSASPSAEAILRKADEHRSPSGDFSFVVKAREYKNKSLSKETAYKVFSKDGKFSLIETIFPERSRGRKLLMRDNALWLFLPNVHRPTRVSLQQKLTGEVSNGDLARTNFVDDYTAKIVGRVKQGKKSFYQLRLSAKNDDVTYRFVELKVEEKTFYPITADFYAVSGKRLKSGEYSGFKKVMGLMRSTRFDVKDALQPSRFTRLDYSRFKRENLPDSFFNKESIVD